MDNTNIRIVKENEVIIREGQINSEMYTIVSGKAAVYFDYGSENEYLVGGLSDGRCFGETGLLTGKPSPFSVVALTDMMLLGIGIDDLEDFIEKEPRKTADIMKNLARMTVTMSANINLLKEELIKTLDDKADTDRVNAINKSILRYRVSGLNGSPYFDTLT